VRFKRALLVLALAALPFTVAAPPASASCQTNPDVGDWCKVQEVVCHNAYKVWELVTGNC
jgi:hypothetical protein